MFYVSEFLNLNVFKNLNGLLPCPAECCLTGVLSFWPGECLEQLGDMDRTPLRRALKFDRLTPLPPTLLRD